MNIIDEGRLDEDHYLKMDEKDMKDRAWADWTDENEKGAGNKKGNVGCHDC